MRLTQLTNRYKKKATPTLESLFWGNLCVLCFMDYSHKISWN